jgi:hypothetical protein
MTKHKETNEIINKMLPRLQQILRIQDWDITVELLDGDKFYKLHDNENQGYTYINRLLKEADIEINIDESVNWHTTLLHELVHIIVDPWYFQTEDMISFLDEDLREKVSSPLKISCEQVVEVLAKILTKIYPLEEIQKKRS